MNTEHFQKSTAYLDGVLLTLAGDKRVIITYGAEQHRFYITAEGDVSLWQDGDEPVADERAFELYRMSFLEALLAGGSLIIRQLGVGALPLPEALGGGTLATDLLSGAAVGPKGVRGLSAADLKAVYGHVSEGGVEFRDLPSKEQVKIALIKRIEQDAA